jgi:hypothetical protein
MLGWGHKPRRASCTICRLPQNEQKDNGISTTLGFFCYGCVKWIHLIADETRALRDNPAGAAEQAEGA